MRAARLALLAIISGCVAATAAAPTIRLLDLARDSTAYRGQTVRTCGWTRNAFEDQLISVSPDAYGPGHTPRPGLQVDWSEASRTTQPGQAEWRCLTGRVEPLCADLRSDQICVSSASPYQWKIIEAPAQRPRSN